jgi:hypothetical protein
MGVVLGTVKLNEYDVDALAAELPIVTERLVIWAAAATLVNAGANDATVSTATSARKTLFLNVFIDFCLLSNFILSAYSDIISLIMRYKLIIAVFSIIAIVFIVENTANAQPYGAGKYDSNVPYGNQTSLSISAIGATMAVNPSTSGTLGTASGPVTVTSTDVVGYMLYIRAVGSSSMTTAVSTIPASANVSNAALSINTWGYNITAGTTFTGITTSDILLKNATGPFSTGDTTTVTYGLNIDRTKSAGNYTSNVIYTAVPQTN